MKYTLTNDEHNKIIDFITSNSNGRIFEINKDRIYYEIELDSFNIDLDEAIAIDNSFNWIIYGSHEDTLTFGGAKLIELIKTLFIARQDKLNYWCWI